MPRMTVGFLRVSSLSENPRRNLHLCCSFTLVLFFSSCIRENAFFLTFYFLSHDLLSWYSFSLLLIAGHRLDTLARMALWEVGLDYLHGTGHGIGSFLNVHEGTLHSCVCVRGCERVRVYKKAYLIIDFFGCAFCINCAISDFLLVPKRERVS